MPRLINGPLFRKGMISICLLFVAAAGSSQSPYRVQDRVTDFPFPGLLNSGKNLSSINDLDTGIILLDFFGTWCVPCIKALPHLAELQEKYRGKISVILVSNEPKDRLEKFISKRQPFPFPVVVDEENSITRLFAPPSYPYTVVMDKHKKIIALTDAAAVSGQTIDEWLAGKTGTGIPDKTETAGPGTISGLYSSNKLVRLSQQLMYAAKTGDSTKGWLEQLAMIPYNELLTQLPTDEEKTAFWINLYNGFTQVLLKQNPGSYKNRGKFFSSKLNRVAGQSFSLDDIEHGILRRSKIKWSLGHLQKLFPGKTEKALRVTVPDYRVHFALNCGAKSCPPIAFYDPENLHPQLESATRVYLSSEAEYDAGTRILELPAIMGWFRRDFGGKRKMIALLKEKKLIPSGADPKIRFKSYDWSIDTNNYSN